MSDFLKIGECILINLKSYRYILDYGLVYIYYNHGIYSYATIAIMIYSIVTIL